MEKRVQEKHWPIVEAFRTLMLRVAPKAEERMRGGTETYYSVPVYRVKRDIVAISPSKSGVTFSFAKGASFDDPFNLLGGTGKSSRNILVRNMGDFREEALKLSDSIAFNSGNCVAKRQKGESVHRCAKEA